MILNFSEQGHESALTVGATLLTANLIKQAIRGHVDGARIKPVDLVLGETGVLGNVTVTKAPLVTFDLADLTLANDEQREAGAGKNQLRFVVGDVADPHFKSVI